MNSVHAAKNIADYVVNRILPESWRYSVVKIIRQGSLNRQHQLAVRKRNGRASTRLAVESGARDWGSCLLSQGYTPLEGEDRSRSERGGVTASRLERRLS